MSPCADKMAGGLGRASGHSPASGTQGPGICQAMVSLQVCLWDVGPCLLPSSSSVGHDLGVALRVGPGQPIKGPILVNPMAWPGHPELERAAVKSWVSKACRILTSSELPGGGRGNDGWLEGAGGWEGGGADSLSPLQSLQGTQGGGQRGAMCS